jgi:acyl-CoA oxidase
MTEPPDASRLQDPLAIFARGQTEHGSELSPRQFGRADEPGANVAAFEALGFGDLSLLINFGVQFGLSGGAVQQLGTRQRRR